MGIYSDQGFANCKVPGFGDTALIDINLPGIGGIGEIVAALANIVQELLAPVIDCINECYYDGDPVIDLLMLLKLAGIDLTGVPIDITIDEFLQDHLDKFVEWLNKPGLGAMLMSFLSTYIGPINDFLDFICSLFASLSCILQAATPENLTKIAQGDISFLEDCIDIQIPWPFPCDWLYFIGDWSFNVPCIEDPFPEGVSLEMPKANIDIGCLLGSLVPGLSGTDLNAIFNALVAGIPVELCEGLVLCTPVGGKIDGFGDISTEWITQILGMILQIPLTIIDNLLSFGTCFFKNIIEYLEDTLTFDASLFDLDIDSVLKNIIDVLNSLQITDIDLDLFDTALDAWIAELEPQLPWLCVLRCVVEKVFSDYIQPLLDFIAALMNLVADAVALALSVLGAPAQILKAFLEAIIQLQGTLGISLLLDDYCLDLASLLNIPNSCLIV